MRNIKSGTQNVLILLPRTCQVIFGRAVQKKCVSWLWTNGFRVSSVRPLTKCGALSPSNALCCSCTCCTLHVLMHAACVCVCVSVRSQLTSRNLIPGSYRSTTITHITGWVTHTYIFIYIYIYIVTPCNCCRRVSWFTSSFATQFGSTALTYILVPIH